MKPEQCGWSTASGRCRGIILVAILVSITLSSPFAWAARDAEVIYPQRQPGQRATSGLTMVYRFRWPETWGYVPIVVQVRPVRRSAVDRKLEVTVIPGGYERYGLEHRVTAPIVLPAGAQQVETEILVPREMSWNQLKVEVTEDGSLLEDLSQRRGWVTFGNTFEPNFDANPAILLIDRDAPDTSAARNTFANGQFTLPRINRLAALLSATSNERHTVFSGSRDDFDDWQVMQALRQLRNMELRRGNDLPDEWLTYWGLDFVVLHVDELVYLSETAPDAWQAIRTAISCGGNLLVYGVGDAYERLPEVQGLLEVAEHGSVDGPAPGEWQRADVERFGLPVVVEGASLGRIAMDGTVVEGVRFPNTDARPGEGTEGYFSDDEQEDELERLEAERLAALRDKFGSPFQLRDYGFGRVAVLSGEELFEFDDLRWDWLLRQLGPERCFWGARHGFVPRNAESSFWSFMISGVGAAPVKSYLGMITVFALVIGPLNYWVLRRRRKLWMLLITVPIGAGLVTCSLFAYAFIADGLGTKVRVRSVTDLDQYKGQAVSISRQSYYAGLAPSSGLVFDESTAVAPIHSHSLYRRAAGSWEMRWRDGQQQLQSGFLPSRSLRQFSVTQPSLSDARVQWNSAEQRFTNQLGVEARYVVLRDQDGTLYWGHELKDQQTVQLVSYPQSQDGETTRSWTEADAMAQLREYIVSRDSAPQINILTSNTRRTIFGRAMYYGYGNQADYSWTDSLLEQAYGDLNVLQRELKPGGYFIVTDTRPSTVPIGIRGATELESIHLIRGRW